MDVGKSESFVTLDNGDRGFVGCANTDLAEDGLVREGGDEVLVEAEVVEDGAEELL